MTISSRARLGAGALAALALLALAACARDDGDAAPKPTSAPTTQPRDLQGEVLAAYRANWTSFFAAADPPKPEHPALLEAKTGPALAAAQRGLGGYGERGVVGRGTFELNPRIRAMDPTRAEVEDCVLDLGRLYDAANGNVVEEPSGTRKRWTAILIFTDGRWKTFEMKSEGPC